MKTAVILPGWQHNTTEPRYQALIQVLEDNEFQVVAHNPDWGKQNTDLWVKDLLAVIPKDADELSFIGFSMGAFIALLASREIELNNLILCSPSGYFSEYENLLTEDDAKWAEENVKDMESLSFTKIIPTLKVERGFILAGSKELEQWDDFRQWVWDLEEHTHWKKIVIPDVKHEVEAPAYQATIAKVIGEL